MTAKNRVVITGIGVISSIGQGKDQFWQSLLSGRIGISEIRGFNTEGLRSKIGGQVHNFDPRMHILGSHSKYGRTSQLAIAASKLAIKDSQIDMDWITQKNTAIIIGTTNGESQVMEKITDKWISGGEQEIKGYDILQYPGNIIALNIAHEIQVDANCMVIPTACAAGNYAIGYGYDLIASGECDVAIVGGSDGFSRAAFMGFNSLFAVAPEKCQPFDKNRKGIVVGEGAGIIILETIQSAQKRGAEIYAEIVGYALSCDASHMTIPNPKGVISVLQRSLDQSGIEPNAVDYISAHGTGTPMNDKVESAAVNVVFPARRKKIPISSIKSMLGHTMGAASALEAIACIMAIKENKIPPTMNYETFDEECNVDCVPNKMREIEVNTAINNSLAFGGNNACVVFSIC